MSTVLTPRAVVTPEFQEAFRNRPRTLTVFKAAVAAEIPSPTILHALFSDDFPATDLTLSRLKTIAKLLNFKGRTHLVLTNVEERNRQLFKKLAEDTYQGKR